MEGEKTIKKSVFGRNKVRSRPCPTNTLTWELRTEKHATFGVAPSSVLPFANVVFQVFRLAAPGDSGTIRTYIPW